MLEVAQWFSNLYFVVKFVYNYVHRAGVHEGCTTFLYPELQICIAEKKTNAIYSSFRLNKKCGGRDKILDIKVFS
jgi:hypothetical protein